MIQEPIRFPWPDPILSPNKRHDRRFITGNRARARQTGWALVKEAGISFEKKQLLQLTIIICPPDRRARDDDNIFSMFKSYRDGMFKALEMDDRNIKRTILEWGEVEKGGALYVTLENLVKGGPS